MVVVMMGKEAMEVEKWAVGAEQGSVVMEQVEAGTEEVAWGMVLRGMELPGKDSVQAKVAIGVSARVRLMGWGLGMVAARPVERERNEVVVRCLARDLKVAGVCPTGRERVSAGPDRAGWAVEGWAGGEGTVQGAVKVGALTQEVSDVELAAAPEQAQRVGAGEVAETG